MEWVETTGRTVADALDSALDELGVHEEDVEFEVLEEPKAGLFGRFGRTDARVRVRLKPISREKPGERRRRKGKGGGRSRGEGSGRGDGPGRGGGRESGARAGARAARASPRRGREREAGGACRAVRVRKAEGNGDGRVGPAAAAPMTMLRRGTRWKSRRCRSSAGRDGGGVHRRVWWRRSALEADVTQQIDDGSIHVEDRRARTSACWSGPKGATLNAIEELVRAVVQREAGGHGARIHVDVGGYRAKRREALAGFTRELVEKVLETGEDQVLEPMPSPDRKVVHDTVGGDRRGRDQLGGRGSPPLRGDPPGLIVTERRRQLLGVLEGAQDLGLLGPGPVEAHVEHSEVWADRARSSSRVVPRPRQRRRGTRPGARARLAGDPGDPAGCPGPLRDVASRRGRPPGPRRPSRGRAGARRGRRP